jgi:hypothetical protein
MQAAEAKSYLVQQQKFELLQQPSDDLNTAPLAVRQPVHAPLQRDVHQVEQLIPACLVPPSANGIEKVLDAQIGSHDGVGRPLGAEPDDARGGIEEDLAAQDLGIGVADQSCSVAFVGPGSKTEGS